jgi:prepilin signal peptidase PulO-like enzyme (type II secretory pathway)
MLLIYIALFILVGRLVQVTAHKLIYKNLDWKQGLEIGYNKNTLWKLWLVDLISILGAYHIYTLLGMPIGYVILDIVLILVMMLTFSTDVREQYILDIYTIPAAIIFLTGRFFIQEYQLWVYISGGIFIGLLLGIVMYVMSGKMGGGDLKLFIALGFYFGIFDLILVLLVASSSGLIYGLYQLKKRKKSEPFAFGPFIVFGVLVVLLTDLSLLVF